MVHLDILEQAEWSGVEWNKMEQSELRLYIRNYCLDIL